MAHASDTTTRIVVLISGSGSNLQALIDAERDGTLNGNIVGVVSNRPDAFGLDRAAAAGISTIVVEPVPGEERRDYDHRLADVVAGCTPDLVVLAGWMRLLTRNFLGRFAQQVINLHPALPGEYPGLHAIERAFADAQLGRRDHTGIMVHFVPDEGVDDGPVIASVTVPIDNGDTIESLTERVHEAEHRLLADTVSALCRTITTRPTHTTAGVLNA